MFRFPLLRTMRERAKSIIADAEFLVANHGKAADDIAGEFQRNANGLGATFYWRAVRKVVSARIGTAVDLLPPAQANNCTACLAERIAGTYDGEGPPLPLACVSCVGQSLGRGLGRQQGLSRDMGNCTTCFVERAAGTHESGGLPVPLACVSCAASGIEKFLSSLGNQEMARAAVWPTYDPRDAEALLKQASRGSTIIEHDASEGK